MIRDLDIPGLTDHYEPSDPNAPKAFAWRDPTDDELRELMIQLFPNGAPAHILASINTWPLSTLPTRIFVGVSVNTGINAMILVIWRGPSVCPVMIQLCGDPKTIKPLQIPARSHWTLDHYLAVIELMEIAPTYTIDIVEEACATILEHGDLLRPLGGRIPNV